MTDDDGKPYSFRVVRSLDAVKEASKLGCELIRLREDGHVHPVRHLFYFPAGFICLILCPKVYVYKVDAFGPEPLVRLIAFESELNFDWTDHEIGDCHSKGEKRRKPAPGPKRRKHRKPAPKRAKKVAAPAAEHHGTDHELAPIQDEITTTTPIREPESATVKSPKRSADASIPQPEKEGTACSPASFAAIRKRLRDELRALKAITPADDDQKRLLKQEKAAIRRTLEEYGRTT